MSAGRARGDAGLGGVEGVAVAALVFVAGTLLVAGAWGVVDAKATASTAAREAARAYVESSAAPEVAARIAAEDVVTSSGRDPARMRIRIDGDLRRCRRIVVEVGYPVRLAALPLAGAAATTVVASARHSELVDAHRSGLDGEARCAR